MRRTTSILPNPSDESAQNSYNYVLDSGRVLKLMGGRRCVFHSATQGKMEREAAVALTEERLKVLRDYIYMNNLQDLYFCPETMGKIAQIGTLEEIVRFCKIDEVYLPCIDFGHLNAREQGSLKTVSDYKDRLEYMIAELGYDRVKHFHVHFSKIQYSAKGEVRHLTFEDTQYGPEFGTARGGACRAEIGAVHRQRIGGYAGGGRARDEGVLYPHFTRTKRIKSSETYREKLTYL